MALSRHLEASEDPYVQSRWQSCRKALQQESNLIREIHREKTSGIGNDIHRALSGPSEWGSDATPPVEHEQREQMAVYKQKGGVVQEMGALDLTPPYESRRRETTPVHVLTYTPAAPASRGPEVRASLIAL